MERGSKRLRHREGQRVSREWRGIEKQSRKNNSQMKKLLSYQTQNKHIDRIICHPVVKIAAKKTSLELSSGYYG